jgi:all-trans-8'-apo-beta-carotenal 15,15'-oxygenase
MAQPIAVPQVPSGAELAARLTRENLPREHGFEPLEVRGAMPADLRGTLLRNGPGLFELYGWRYRHLFEGDGAITAVRFGDGAAGAVRITESAGLREERAARRPLHNFAVSWPRRLWNLARGRQKNTANTSVMTWQGRTLALMEAGRPTEILVGASDLTTLGETDLGGVVGRTFSAHPHRVPSRATTYNFGVEYGRSHELRLYALPDLGAARLLTRVPLRVPVMVHDFVVTDRHAIWFLHPLELDLARVFTGRVTGLDELFRWRGEHASEVVVVSLDRPSEIVRFEVPHAWVWHFASAKSRGPGELVVDYVRYRDASSFTTLARDADRFEPGTPHRAVIDLRACTFRSEPVASCAAEFPRVHPELEAGDYRDVWLAIDDGAVLGRLDVETGALVQHALPPGQRGDEPILVPKRGPGRGERDVWVLVLAYDGVADRSGVLVFDGARFPDAPVASAWFDHRVPITFHGTWVGAA